MAEHLSYVGSGPYCYANSLAMMLGKDSPSPAVIEFATSSPFGMQMVGSGTAFFDPYGWDPSLAFDAALKAAGWEATLVIGSDTSDALSRLKAELAKGNAVFVGPVEMGLLRYQPDMRGAIGADHYIVVLRITDDDEVEVHDPHGYPYATLPIADFMAAWRAEKIAYGKPYMMRTDFRRVELNLSEADVIRRSLANGYRWLSMEGEHGMPPGSCGNGMAAEKLVQMIKSKTLSQGTRAVLVHFAVRVGARRLADGATCLGRIGEAEAASIMAKQARLVGALQRPLVDGDDTRVVSLLRQLAPTYEALRDVLGAP